MKKQDKIQNDEEIEDRFQRLREINITQEDKKKKDKEIDKIKSLNQRISNFLGSKNDEMKNNEEKKKIGIIIFSLILLVLVSSAYYFLIYEPYQEELSSTKTSKLNELNFYYKGPLITDNEAYTLKKQIENSNSVAELEMIDISRSATKSWKDYQLKSVKINTDQFNRTMAVYSTNETRNVIMDSENATEFINKNDASVLSTISFKKPDTVAVPILVNRLQASGGLLNLGSIIDIYFQNSNGTNQTADLNNSNPVISGSTVLSIIRCEDNGIIEADYSKSEIITIGNLTNPNEKVRSFSTSVEEMLKGAIAGGYNEEETINMLRNYGLKLSDYERQANLGDLESEYILIIEVPQNKTPFILQNMDNLIITIPTEHAPDWMINELSKAYS
ncbi:MAG: DUF515 domain-containing protein [Methanobacteriaceae archaeon]|jgi:hypothetical protein|nr:DUF515 domain-containing protein [Methanobacteriaceae archaeon]